MPDTYGIGQVAALTGVSVRTLHHYDHVGLVQPAERTEAGYRRYTEHDVLRLQQVLTLRYLGFGLGEIGDLLARPDFDVSASLRAQRRVVRDRVAELQRLDGALAVLLEGREAAGEWDWDLVLAAARAVHEGTERSREDMERYYTREQLADFAELREQTPASDVDEVHEGWTALVADVQAAADLDPAGAAALALLQRWDALTERTAQAFAAKPGLWRAIGDNLQAGSFAGQPGVPSPEDFAFIEAVRQAQRA